jgi:hypothetical protein
MIEEVEVWSLGRAESKAKFNIADRRAGLGQQRLVSGDGFKFT